jgi:hypothetical protein
MSVISFENALKLKRAGCNIPAAKAYRYHTESHKEVQREGIKTITTTWEDWDGDQKTVFLGETSQQKRELSDRFYDSWNDALAYAYSTRELAQIIALVYPVGHTVSALAEPDTLVEQLIGLNFQSTQLEALAKKGLQ